MYSDVTGGGSLPVSIGWINYALSVGAGLVAVAVVIGPAIAFGHGSVVAGKRDAVRPDETPFIHRYFLDFALLAGAGYLAWELNLRGGVPVSVSSTGQIETDNAILFLPALLLVAISLVFLRLFPVSMRALVRIALPGWSRSQGPSHPRCGRVPRTGPNTPWERTFNCGCFRGNDPSTDL
jgi:hypothetical protein